MLGEPRSTLRYWEDFFGLRIERSKKGQRVYSKNDVERLRRIQSLIREKKFTLSGAKAIFAEHRSNKDAGAE